MIDYLWIKAFHVVAVITWMGGLFVLSLLMSAQWHTFGLRMPQERRLLFVVRRWDRAVTAPAMVLTWVLGLVLAIHGGWFGTLWLSLKVLFVIALSALHGIQAGAIRHMIGAGDWRPSSWMRLASLFMIAAIAAIACLVIIKPW
jgi:uncharacterized membrane protein